MATPAVEAASPPRVLFLCTANSCRSQMAEGWARSLGAGAVVPRSAGTHPGALNTLAVAAMAEAGIDISFHTPKHLHALHAETFDLIVTVCDAARETCPIMPAATRHIHRSFDDPPRLAASARTHAEALPHYRRVRDEIKAFVASLLRDLAAQQPTHLTHKRTTT